MNSTFHQLKNARIQLSLAYDLDIQEEIVYWSNKVRELEEEYRQSIQQKQHETKKGFTLVELVVVILIIAILFAVLVPSFNAVRITAKEAAVLAEIKDMETGIVNFKLKYGNNVPDFFVLYEYASGWNNPSPELEYETRRSKAFIMSVWPQFDFENYGDKPGTLASWQRQTIAGKVVAGPSDNCIGGNKARDFDGDGKEDGILIFNGIESLVFFLGGINITENTKIDGSMEENKKRPIKKPETWSPNGFSINPEMPFVRGGTRFYCVEFDNKRLYQDEDKTIPKYMNIFNNQYCYYSSYYKSAKAVQPIPYKENFKRNTFQILVKGDKNILTN